MVNDYKIDTNPAPTTHEEMKLSPPIGLIISFGLLGICFLRGALEVAVEGIGDGEKGGCFGSGLPGKEPP